MDFSLEDLDIEVTKNDEDTDMDVAAADGEAKIQIENMLRIGERIVAVTSNLTDMIGHVKKFGITKPMLHLHNKKNRLGRAARMTLPTYESDDQFDDVDPSDYDKDAVVAGLEGAFSDAKNKIVEWFKKMIDTITNFFKSRWGTAARLEKRLIALKTKLKGNPDWDKVGSLEIETYKFDKMQAALTALNTAFTELQKIDISGAAEFPNTMIDKINTGLAFVGYAIVADEKDKVGEAETIKYKIEDGADGKLEKEKEKLNTLGWSVGAMDKQIDPMKAYIKLAAKGDALISTLKKAQSKASKVKDNKANDAAKAYEEKKSEEKKTNTPTNTTPKDDMNITSKLKGYTKGFEADGDLDDLEKKKDSAQADTTNLVNRATVIIKAVTKITDAMFNLVSVFCAIGEKIPMKK